MPRIKDVLALDAPAYVKLFFPNINKKIIWCLECPEVDVSDSQIFRLMDKVHMRGGARGKDYVITSGALSGGDLVDVAKIEVDEIERVYAGSISGFLFITTNAWISLSDDFLE